MMRIIFLGDVMLGRLVNRELSRRPPEYPWGDTLKVLKEADARVANLECAISDRGRPWSATPKAFHFRSDARNVAVLKAAGIDAVSLANNHTLDYGVDALLDTLDVLDRAGIKRAGAGRDIEEARRPAFIDSGGARIAFIAFTDNEPAWEASIDRPGVYYVPVDIEDARAIALFERVRSLRKEADSVIVSAHWGPNRGYRPVQSHIPFGERLIDSGASIVFGHSCHVFQAVEFYGDGAIIYSAGDFIDDYAVDERERNDESFIFAAEMDHPVSSVRLYPTVIEDFSARLAGYPRAELIASKMKGLCDEFGSETHWDDLGRCLELKPEEAAKKAV